MPEFTPRQPSEMGLSPKGVYPGGKNTQLDPTDSTAVMGWKALGCLTVDGFVELIGGLFTDGFLGVVGSISSAQLKSTLGDINALYT